MPIEEDPPTGAPEWVVTYGDMMSLLLTFFIMLVSMSKLKEEGSMRAMLDGINEAFGADVGEFGVPGPSRQKTSALNKLGSLGKQSQGGDQRSNPDTKGSGGPNTPVRSMSKGPALSLGGPALFPKFAAELTPELQSQVDTVIGVLLEKEHAIEIRGHTSPEPLPPDSPYPDLLALAFARAHLVAKMMIQAGIAEERIIVTAAGEAEPLHQTADSTKRLLNDRVDVFLTETYIAPTEKPPGR